MSSSTGKLLNVRDTLPEVVNVTTFPSAKEQAIDPVTVPLATIFCPQSLSTNSD